RRAWPILAPGPALDAYIIAHADRALQQIFWTNNGLNTAGFVPLNTAPPIEIGVRRLCGCTVLLIYNPAGVYYAHFWESTSFSTWTRGAQSSDKFRSEVEDVLRGVTAVNGFQDLVQFAPTLDNAQSQVYIMTPLRSRQPRNKSQYWVDINRLSFVVSQILPNALAAQVINYDAVDHKVDQRLPLNQQLLETTTHGCFLFQYDTDLQNIPRVRLFMESLQIF
ncbi:hypothetical protein GP486_008834, partial [Trichoglossum hirsutum]